METSLQIQQLSDGLRIRASQPLQLWERLLAAGFAGTFVAYASVALLKGWWPVLSPIVAAIVFSAVKIRSAQLRVTKCEFATTGDLGRRVQTPRVINTADVLALKFQVSPFQSQHDGLYAQTAKREICILPFLDWEQTQEVIAAVEQRFPGLAELWHSRIPPRRELQ